MLLRQHYKALSKTGANVRYGGGTFGYSSFTVDREPQNMA